MIYKLLCYPSNAHKYNISKLLQDFYFTLKKLSLRRCCVIAGTSGSSSLSPQARTSFFLKANAMSYSDDEKENEAATRANFFREENDGNSSGSDGGAGGDGAPNKRLAEKGEEKEEVVNVEKPRRNLKRRCIDSNRRLSYSTAADLRGTSRLVDVRRYCPAIPPPPFTPSVPYAYKSAPLLSRSVHSRRPLLLLFSSYVHTLSSLGGERMRADVWAVWSLGGGRRLQKCRERTVICVATLALILEDRNLQI